MGIHRHRPWPAPRGRDTLTRKQLQALHRQHDRQVAQTLGRLELGLERSYARVHRDLTLHLAALILRHTSKPQLIEATKEVAQAPDIDKRLRTLNPAIDAIPHSADRIVKMTAAQTKKELTAVGFPLYDPITPDPRMLDSDLERAVNKLEGWNDRIKPDILKLLRQAIKSRLTPKQIATRVRDLDDQQAPVRKARSHAIINTRYAVARATNTARELTYDDASAATGVPVDKMWMASIEDCCLSCALLHGQVAHLHDDFAWKDLGLTTAPWRGLPHPPLHPNCRCRIVAVTADTMKILDLGRIRRERQTRVQSLKKAA